MAKHVVTLLVNVWQHRYSGEQFLGKPASDSRRYLDGRTLVDNGFYRRVGVLRVKPKDHVTIEDVYHWARTATK